MEYVYILHCKETTLYKIGRSLQPQIRLKQIQRDHSYPLTIFRLFECENGLSSYWESLLHQMYRQYRCHGEWFKIPEQGLPVCTLGLSDAKESIECVDCGSEIVHYFKNPIPPGAKVACHSCHEAYLRAKGGAPPALSTTKDEA